MRFSAETTTDGVTERLFTIGDASGAVWAPAGADGPACPWSRPNRGSARPSWA